MKLFSQPLLPFIKLSFILMIVFSSQVRAIEIGDKAPQFTHSNEQDWINSAPLHIEDLAGSVFLLDVWTFECWNCYRSFPWLTAIESRFKDDDFTVIGLHSPEFKREHDREAVIAKAKQFELHHPIMIDNDFSYWKALNNRYWPTYYIFDKKGVLRGTYIGETHKGDKKALAIESKIAELLAED